jgi:DNA-binding SARP family transcriptional activator
MERSWRIELLGRLRATRGGQVITHFRTQKTALLLAYLAYYRNRPHARSALTELLWPDSPVDAARANLSNALSWLRRQFQEWPADAAWPGRAPSLLSLSRTTPLSS